MSIKGVAACQTIKYEALMKRILVFTCKWESTATLEETLSTVHCIITHIKISSFKRSNKGL